MILRQFPPMGVYETLFKFADATAKYMGEPGTHPWAQGFPLTQQLPNGPELPGSVSFGAADLKYPKATGNEDLRTAIVNYYNHFYGSRLVEDNVCIFAGGRPAIFATMAFMDPTTTILIEETEYTPYYDMIQILDRSARIIPSRPENRFRPSLEDTKLDPVDGSSTTLLIKSNPCNPTGVAATGDDLRALVDFCREPGRAGLFDEAYEFFCDPEPESALKYCPDIDGTDIFVVGAATKGLQVPGLRVGWIVASRDHIEIFRNYSSFGMGGVSRASQLYVANLLDLDRVTHARQAVGSFYTEQRQRYGEGLASLGFELYTGKGGFYHWGRLPGDHTADSFNTKLFAHDAGILPGPLCDMLRRRGGDDSMERFIRFSFGPLTADSFEDDMRILEECV